MNVTWLFTLGLFALCAQADLFVAQDLGYGNVVYTSTSPRLSGNTISAPDGMYATSIRLPEQGGVPDALAYPNSNFVSDFFDAGPSSSFDSIDSHMVGSVQLSMRSTFGNSIACISTYDGRCTSEFSPYQIIWGSDSGQFVTDIVEVQYAGSQPIGSISGNVYNDLPDYPTQPGLADQTVELLSQPALPLGFIVPITTMTDAEGNYSFTGLPAGTYEVIDPVPGGVTQAFTGTDPTNIRLAWDQNVSNVDFGDGYFGTGYVPEPGSVWLLFTILFPVALRQFYSCRKTSTVFRVSLKERF